jgi:hypothetical protein
MSIQVTFTMTRADTTTDFFWESTIPEIAQICRDIDVLANFLNVQRTFTKADDGLSCTSQFVAPDDATWIQFMNTVVTTIPNMISRRNQYLVAAGHTINMTITHLETGVVQLQTSDPIWAVDQPV